MSSKDILQPYEPDLASQRAGQARTLLTVGAPGADECGQWYSPEAVLAILADAHAHYEAQVRPRTGLAKPSGNALREAAQALLDQFDAEARKCGSPMSAHAFRRLCVLRVALDVPAPTDDERVAEHMRQDAEHAAMYRWLREHPYAITNDSEEGGPWLSTECLDAAIRAAMKESK